MEEVKRTIVNLMQNDASMMQEILSLVSTIIKLTEDLEGASRLNRLAKVQ